MAPESVSVPAPDLVMPKPPLIGELTVSVLLDATDQSLSAPRMIEPPTPLWMVADSLAVIPVLSVRPKVEVSMVYPAVLKVMEPAVIASVSVTVPTPVAPKTASSGVALFQVAAPVQLRSVVFQLPVAATLSQVRVSAYAVNVEIREQPRRRERSVGLVFMWRSAGRCAMSEVVMIALMA